MFWVTFRSVRAGAQEIDLSKPWGVTKANGATDSTTLEMSDWLVEMLARGADRAAIEPRAELKARAMELYAQLQSSLEDAEDD